MGRPFTRSPSPGIKVMNGLDGIKSVTALLFLCFGFFHVIHANENENEEEVAPLYLNSNHLNSRVARSAEPYYYSYWNDLKRGDPSHLLRFNKRGGMQDDHLLRFAKNMTITYCDLPKNPMITCYDSPKKMTIICCDSLKKTMIICCDSLKKKTITCCDSPKKMMITCCDLPKAMIICFAMRRVMMKMRPWAPKKTITCFNSQSDLITCCEDRERKLMITCCDLLELMMIIYLDLLKFKIKLFKWLK